MTLPDAQPCETGNTVRPVFGRPGGKSRTACKIVEHFPPPDSYTTYVEPYAGGASVLMAKLPSPKEILGDLDVRVTTLLNAAKAGVQCQSVVASQAEERKLISENSPEACDIVSTLRCSFGKQGQHPSRPEDYPCKVNWPADQHVERLKNVIVENSDYKTTMRKYDSKSTLHYLDPPYHQTKNSYGPGLDRVDPEEVRRIALDMEGKVIISYNDAPKIREIFCKDPSLFHCHEIEQAVLSTSRGAMGVRKDLVIEKQ